MFIMFIPVGLASGLSQVIIWLACDSFKMFWMSHRGHPYTWFNDLETRDGLPFDIKWHVLSFILDSPPWKNNKNYD